MAARDKFEAGEFAKYAATFTNNPSEAESIAGARLLLRESKRDGGGRLVDLFYRADVMAALDAVLQPVRQNPDKAAREAAETEAAELRAMADGAIAKAMELTSRTEELLREKEQLTARLMGQPSGAANQGRGAAERTAGGWLAALAALAAAGMMIASAFR